MAKLQIVNEFRNQSDKAYFVFFTIHCALLSVRKIRLELNKTLPEKNCDSYAIETLLRDRFTSNLKIGILF